MITISKSFIAKPKTYTNGSIHYSLPKALIVDLNISNSEPTCYFFAAKSPEWRTAKNMEFDALLKNGTFPSST